MLFSRFVLSNPFSPTRNLRWVSFSQVVVPAGGSGGWRTSQHYEMRFMKLKTQIQTWKPSEWDLDLSGQEIPELSVLSCRFSGKIESIHIYNSISKYFNGVSSHVLISGKSFLEPFLHGNMLTLSTWPRGHPFQEVEPDPVHHGAFGCTRSDQPDKGEKRPQSSHYHQMITRLSPDSQIITSQSRFCDLLWSFEQGQW